MKLDKLIDCNPKELRKKGIYKIYSLDGTKVYIGSTFHKHGILKRLNEHFRLLDKNKHHSRMLQFYFNKYGRDGLKVSIVEEVTDKSLLIEREQYWINYFI